MSPAAWSTPAITTMLSLLAQAWASTMTVYVDRLVAEYAWRCVTPPPAGHHNLADLQGYIAYGASPGARSTWSRPPGPWPCSGRSYCLPQDVQELARDVTATAWS